MGRTGSGAGDLGEAWRRGEGTGSPEEPGGGSGVGKQWAATETGLGQEVDERAWPPWVLGGCWEEGRAWVQE